MNYLTFLLVSIFIGVQAGELSLINLGPTLIGFASGKDSITDLESLTVLAVSSSLVSPATPPWPPKKSPQGSNISLGMPMSARKLKLSAGCCWLEKRLS